MKFTGDLMRTYHDALVVAANADEDDVVLAVADVRVLVDECDVENGQCKQGMTQCQNQNYFRQ